MLSVCQYPRVHETDFPSQKLFLGIPIDVVGQRHRHTEGQRQNAVEIAPVLIVVLKPPGLLFRDPWLIAEHFC